MVCYYPSNAVKRFRDIADDEASYEWRMNRYTTGADSDNSKLDTKKKNLCIVPGIIGCICKFWQSRKATNEQAFDSLPITLTMHNNPMRKGIRLI